MDKKTNVLTLMFIMLSTGMFWYQSCTDFPKDAVRSDTETQKTTESQKSVDEIKSIAYTKARDYILNVNGYNSYMLQLNSSRSKSEDSLDIINIKNMYSLGETMTRHVIDSGMKILNESYSKILSMFEKYGITLGDKIISNDEEFVILTDSDNDTDITYCYKPDMVFVGAGKKLYSDMGANFWIFRETDGAFNRLLFALNDVVTKSSVDDKTKSEIKSWTNAIINKTKRNLQINRQRVEREYKYYYLLDEYGKNSMGIGNYVFGYDALDDEDINGKYAITRRYTSVYNPNLNQDFFADTTAKYKLVNVGSNLWRVEKHFGNGKIDKSPMFNGRAVVSRYTNVSQIPEGKDDTNFEFEPDTIKGGRVYFNEVIKTKTRTKDWVVKIPPQAQHTIDSLNQEILRKEQLIKIAKEKAKEADSIANNIVQKKFTNHQR